MLTFARATRRELTLIFFAAGGFFLAFPNPLIQLPFAVLFMPASILLLSLEAKARSRAISCSFLCMFLGSSFALYWLTIPMHNFAGIPWVVGASCVMLLGLYYGLYGLIFSLLTRFFSRRLSLYPALAASAGSWGALELFRGYFLTGFPWLSLSSAFAGWPVLAQGGAILGMYGLSALYVLIALLLALLFHTPIASSETMQIFTPLLLSRAEKNRKLLLPALALLTCIIAYGTQRLGTEWDKQGESFLAAMVQGNTSQMQKWTAENRNYILKRYLALSRQALELVKDKYERSADLLLWPETAMPFAYELSPESAALIKDFTASQSTPLLFGAVGVDDKFTGYNRTYNRLILLGTDSGAPGHYDKEHLVPFGEYLPPGIHVPFASEFLQGTGFTPGKNLSGLVLSTTRQLVLGPLICYEVIFPELAQKRVEQNANLLVSVSNDAWFEFSPAPLQHLQLAAMRCIEQGRYMLRSTNTGISAAIDPAGRILNPSPLFEPWIQVESVRVLEEKTIYHDWYFWITGALWFIPLLLFVVAVIQGFASSSRKPAKL
ncbi:MAG: apolipoprotein N-acyltransferase [Deltaproteobacteria bacterium]|jgi:apolipoprotein N-acyltransferase|nr:apolipoprotein N-acyltransferase [Deltaproteobacteria bacterium]